MLFYIQTATSNFAQTQKNLKYNIMRVLTTVAFALGMAIMGSSCSSNNSVTVSGQQDGHDYVDLGLPSGTLWATSNVGAEKATDYGNYFSWGETSPKAAYDWQSYNLGNGSDSKTKVNKYCVNERKGNVDNKTVLEANDDAATVNWGGKWRTPTLDELNELKNGCDWEWVNNFNGVAGRLGKSKTNGNTIFLPFSGNKTGDKHFAIGTDAYYWAANLYTDNSTEAYGARVLTGNFNCLNFARKQGFAIRAVASK